MPRLEAYEQQVTAQPAQGGSVPIESFTGGWKTATETFKTLDDTVKVFKKVQDFNQESEATLGLVQELDAIKQEASNERDPAKLAEYRSKVDNAIATHSGKITDGLLKTQVQQKFALSGYNAFSDIQNDFRKKEIDLGQANFMTLMDKYSRSYTEASDDVSRKVIRDSMDNLITSSFQSGLFDAADVTKMKIANEKELDSADLAYDIQNLPDQVENRRAQGAYKSLTDDEIQKGIQTANSMREQMKKQAEYLKKESQISNEVALMSSSVSGQPASIDDVRRMVANEEIRQDVGIAYIDFLASPNKVDATTDGTAFVTTLDEIFKSGNKEQISNVIKNTLKGGTDGKLSEDDLATLIAVANNKNEFLLSVDKEGQKKGSPWAVFENINNAMKEWTKQAKFPSDVSDEVMKEFAVELSGAKTEEDAKAAQQKVMEKAKASINPKYVQYKVGDTITAPNKRVYKVVGHDTDGEPLVDLVK